MKRILDLSVLTPNQIVRLIPADGKCYGNPACFCVVKEVAQVPKRTLVASYTSSRAQETMKEEKYAYSHIELLEFKKGGGSYSMTIPTTTSDNFLSIADTEYEFALEESSLEELKLELAKAENAEIGAAYEAVAQKVANIKQSYKSILHKTLEGLVG